MLRPERLRRRVIAGGTAIAAVLALANLPTASAASPPVPASVQSVLDRIVNDPAYVHSFWGYEVVDESTGQVLVSQNADKMFVTGSILKVYSTTTALSVLGPNFRFRTPVYRRGRVSKGTLKGNLVLVGSGDFSFGLREQKNGTLAYNNSPQIDHNYADTGLAGPALVPNSHPLAGVDQLARQVRASGIRRVTGNIAIDDRLFTPYNGWPDGRISSIWVNENVIDVTAKPTSAGRAARISYRPHTAAYRVISQVTTVNGPGKPRAVSSPRPGIVRITGQLSSKSAPILSIYQIPDPASFARTAFIEALRRAGVRVAARSTGANPRGLLSGNRRYPAGDRVALRVSPPLSEFVKVILKVSYNRGADDMVCLVAAKIGSRNCIDGLDRELTSITKLGVSPASTILFDGAGSEEFDRSSLTDYTTYLRNAARQPWGAAFHAGLPILGVDGTFAQNQRGTPAAGHVFVKSGTRAMSAPTDKQGIISALTQAGYIDAKSGRKLVYAMFLRDLPLGTDATAFETADHQQGEIAAAFWAGY